MQVSLSDRIVLREILWPLAVGLLAILQLLVVIQLLQLNEIVFGSAVTRLLVTARGAGGLLAASSSDRSRAS